MKRPERRLKIVREECQTRDGRKKLRWRMRQRGFCTPSFARDLVAAAEAAGTANPAGSLSLLRFCVQIARRSGDRCSHVRLVELLSGVHRLLGDLELSDRTLGAAFRLADGCCSCQPILHRGLAFLRSKQGRRELALEAADQAVEFAGALADKVEGGRSLLCRGIIRCKSGQLSTALADGVEALRALPRDDGQYGAALYAYAVMLSRVGDFASVQRAADLLQEIERTFRGLKGLSLERSMLAWLHGDIAQAQGDDRQALRDLENARSGFARLDMPVELAGVCADIGAILAKRPWPMEAVRQMLTSSANGIVFPAALRNPLNRVLQATRASLAELRIALRELRAATVDLGCPPPILAYP